jgi:hypothetical protein
MLRQILANSVEQLEATPHRGDPWRLNEEALREAARAAHRILNSLAARAPEGINPDLTFWPLPVSWFDRYHCLGLSLGGEVMSSQSRHFPSKP